MGRGGGDIISQMRACDNARAEWREQQEIAKQKAQEEARFERESARINSLADAHSQSDGKPLVDLGDLKGPDGNAMVILANVRSALEKAGQKDKAEEFTSKFFQNSYQENLEMVDEYVQVVTRPMEYQPVSAADLLD